jgi:hypothetical protein
VPDGHLSTIYHVKRYGWRPVVKSPACGANVQIHRSRAGLSNKSVAIPRCRKKLKEHNMKVRQLPLDFAMRIVSYFIVRRAPYSAIFRELKNAALRLDA